MRIGCLLAFVAVMASASTAVAFPDTLLGARNQMGQVFLVDDDGSPLGDGYASGLFGLPINVSSIAFVVSGYGDGMFLGAHTQSGPYTVFVAVYSFYDDPIASFSQAGTLQPGTADEYSFSDPAWAGGSYNVYVDNLVPEPAGVSVVAAAALALVALRRRSSSAGH